MHLARVREAILIYKKEIVYNELLGRISRAEYLAQTYIDEQSIAEELETSRTPVREALMELANEGYVEILPKRGIIVLPFTYQNALDIFQTRELLEPWLITTYGPKIDKEELRAEYPLIREEILGYPAVREAPGVSVLHHPHNLLVKHCTNKLVKDILTEMERQSRRKPNERIVLKKYEDGMDREKMIRSHELLVDLMLADRYEEAAGEMRRHIRQGQKEYMEYWFQT